MENKQSFEELKNEILEKAKAAGACNEGYESAENAENEKELLEVISEYLDWCISHKVVTREYLDKFELQNLIDAGLANTGKENTGIANSGNSNSGNWNSGDRNSGNRNSGNWNSGYSNSGNWNSGDRNSGYRNSGDRNSGYRNSGDRNSGDRNSGDSNSGNWNSGDRNSGDSNSGYRNSGAFCTDNNPRVRLFDVETDMGVREWENHPAYRLMEDGLNFTFWVNESEMTDAEKEKFSFYKTTGGYLKTIPHKEGWANFWGNLSNENKKVFTSLPNFDPAKFEFITGIKTN